MACVAPAPANTLFIYSNGSLFPNPVDIFQGLAGSGTELLIAPVKSFDTLGLKSIESDNISAIKEYYNYSNEKARDVLPLLSNENLKTIRGRINHGGIQR